MTILITQSSPDAEPLRELVDCTGHRLQLLTEHEVNYLFRQSVRVRYTSK